jgi:hypothetical protein
MILHDAIEIAPLVVNYKELLLAVDSYEKALCNEFPCGASGVTFEYWNEARLHILRSVSMNESDES